MPTGWQTREYTYDEDHPHAVSAVSPLPSGAPFGDDKGQGEGAYIYDANGNMTCRVEDGVTYKQEYNTENRISAIHKLDGDCETGVITESWNFAYDGDGVRTTTLHFTGSTLDSSTYYYFDGAYELRDSAALKYYSFGGQTVAMHDGTGLQYFLTDHLGSIIAITDENGTLTSQQRYLPPVPRSGIWSS